MKETKQSKLAELLGYAGRYKGLTFLGLGLSTAAMILGMAPYVCIWLVARDLLAAAPDWLPAEDISEPVRLMAFRLFGRDHNPAAFYAGNGLLVQGLLHLFMELCVAHHPLCADCSLGDPLEVFQQPVVSNQQPAASNQ